MQLCSRRTNVVFDETMVRQICCFESLEWCMNVEYPPLNMLTLKQVMRERQKVVQLTEAGRIAVIANMLCGPAHDSLIRARNLLIEHGEDQKCSWEVNSALCSSVYALGSILDAIAAARHAVANDGSP